MRPANNCLHRVMRFRFAEPDARTKHPDLAASGAGLPRSRGLPFLVYRPDWCCDRELPDCVDDPQPSCDARKIAIRREFLGPFGAFRHSLAAVAREHQVGDPPDVDFRYHAERLAGGTSIYG